MVLCDPAAVFCSNVTNVGALAQYADRYEMELRDCGADKLVNGDTLNSLESPATGFYIGCGKNMQAGTHFSGLIDDVRIYNRAVKP